jgi:hypothetical protein
VDCEENAGGKASRAGFANYFPTGPPEFLLKEITFIPGWTLRRIRNMLPDQKIQLCQAVDLPPPPKRYAQVHLFNSPKVT